MDARARQWHAWRDEHDRGMSDSQGRQAERTAGLTALALLVIGCLLVLRPFFSAILWAVFFAYAAWPGFKWLRDKTTLSAGACATVMVSAAALLVVVPLALAAPASREDVVALGTLVQDAFRDGLPPAPQWVADLPMIGAPLAAQWNGLSADLGALSALLRPYVGMFAEFGLSVLLGIASGLVDFTMALFIAWFLFRHGPVISERTKAIGRRLAGARADQMLELTGHVVRGVVYGLLGTAIVQGILTFLGLWVSGVPRPGLLGVIAGLISVLPVGAPLVYIPAAIWLLAIGETFWAIALFLWGALVVSTVDNFIRPYFIAQGADLPFLLSIIGVLGGVVAFGFLGLFLGPVLLALGYTLVAEWGRRDAAPSSSGAEPLA
jgi:predicted PurR-regulated permease PerM